MSDNVEFSKWPQESVDIYKDAVIRDAQEVQNDLSNVVTYASALIAANGTVLGMLMSVVAIVDLDWMVIIGVSPLFVSLLILAESTQAYKRSMIVEINSLHDVNKLAEEPRKMEEEMLNAMVSKIDVAQKLYKRYSAGLRLGVTIFVLGLVTFGLFFLWSVGTI